MHLMATVPHIFTFYTIVFLIKLQVTFANDSGLFFNSAPYNTASKKDESWKDTDDPNPWLVETPNNPSQNTKTDDSDVNSKNGQNQFFQNPEIQTPQNQQFQSNNQPYQMSQNRPFQSNNQQYQMPQNQKFHSQNQQKQVPQNQQNQVSQNQVPQNQQNSRTGGNLNPQNEFGSPSIENLAGSVKDIYLKRVNIGEDSNQRPNYQAQPQPVVPADQSIQGSYNLNSYQNGKRINRVYSNKHQTSENRASVTPAPTTTTTSSTTTKYGDGMFFNAQPYKTNQKKDNDQEPDWKRNNEPNPFLIENPNQPKQNQNGPQLNMGKSEQKMDRQQHFDRRGPESGRQQRPDQKPVEQSPPQQWKTKWQMEDEEAELKHKVLEKAKHPPPVRNDLEIYQKTVDTPYQKQPNRPPPAEHNRHMNNHMDPIGNAGTWRENFERSGELERVPKDYYKDIRQKLAADLKFMEPDPEPEPINLERHSKSKPSALKSLEIEENPPTSIQKMKNWFVKKNSSGSGNSENNKLVSLILSILLCLYI